MVLTLRVLSSAALTIFHLSACKCLHVLFIIRFYQGSIIGNRPCKGYIKVDFLVDAHATQFTIALVH